MKGIIPVEQAVAKIKDGSTIAVSGSGGGLLEPDLLLKALAARYSQTGHPKDLTIVHGLGIGDGKGGGLAQLAQKGMLKRIIGGHWSWSRELQTMALENEIEAYTLPAGIIMTLFREIGAGRPGVITKVGLGTFADPDHGGGKVNERAMDDLVEKVTLDNEDYLRYKPFEIDVALVRGTCTDRKGNISTCSEAADLDAYSVAMAAKNSGGYVIAQVKDIQEAPFTPARSVTIPGVIVDAIVHHPEQQQTHVCEYEPAISGEALRRGEPSPRKEPEGLRRVVAGIAARELKPNQTVNYGFGMPDGVSAMASAELIATCTEMVEQGIHNGELQDGVLFGSSKYPDVIVNSNQQFDFFAGGGLDITFLGMGEMDRQGNVNVSKLGPYIVGPGGFVDIAFGAQKVVFCGTFEAKGLRASADNGRLFIDKHGEVPKLVEQVQHITFSGPQAANRGQQVLYITERAVFELTEQGVKLKALVDGVDLEKDVLARMAFRPIVGEYEVISAPL